MIGCNQWQSKREEMKIRRGEARQESKVIVGYRYRSIAIPGGESKGRKKEISVKC